MKSFLIIVLCFLSYSTQAEDCSILNTQKPQCYYPRKKTQLNIALIHYGSFINQTRLKTIGQILKNRFLLATNYIVSVNIIDYKILPLKQKLPKDYEFNNIKDKKRLHRIWYYDFMNTKVIQESYQEYKNNSSTKLLSKLDALLVISEAQFDGLGFAIGRIGITENPMEIAWGATDGGKTEDRSDYQIVDELIHELGHIMFLGHTSSQCFKPGMTYREMMACCEKSPSKNDVLSYCRQRKKVNEVYFHRFESCNLNMIERLIAPAIRDGGTWNVPGRSVCD